MDREQALETALGQIERNFGKGAVMKMSDRGNVSVGAVSTGSLSLDLALGIGGLPRGRVVEVYGPESSGKTTLVYHVIAEAQRRGGICAFIDAEHAMDPNYAKRIGVNVDELLVSQPDTGEQALEICELLVRSGALAVVAIDSVAALTPKAEIEGEMGDSHVGLQARLMSQALRKLAGTLNRTETICLFTNQLREKIGVMFGSPETTPGGKALKFYASVRLDIRRIETLKDGVEAFGNRVRVKVVKNKVAPPFKQAEFDIIYGDGISWEGTVLDSGLDRKVVTKSGSYFSFEDERLGQGRHNATAFLREHPDVVQQILTKIQAQIGPDQIVSARLLPLAAASDTAKNGKAKSSSPSPRPSRAGGSRRGGAQVKTVSALRVERRGRVLVELDGEPWRSLRPRWWRGRCSGWDQLDRPRLRELGRELRRAEALARATRALEHRDLSSRALEERLARPAWRSGSASRRSRRSNVSATSTTSASRSGGRRRSPTATGATRRSPPTSSGRACYPQRRRSGDRGARAGARARPAGRAARAERAGRRPPTWRARDSATTHWRPCSTRFVADEG